MSDEELLVHVRGMRHRREVIRPARAKIIEKAEKKVSKAKTKKMGGLLDAMSEEDRLKLIALLQQGQ
jgi:hypothetical protein